MGFDPNRPMKRRPSDIILVVAAFAVSIALILWVLFG